MATLLQLLVPASVQDRLTDWPLVIVRLPSATSLLKAIGAVSAAGLGYKLVRRLLDAELTQFEATFDGNGLFQPTSRRARLLACALNDLASTAYNQIVRWGYLSRFRPGFRTAVAAIHRKLHRAPEWDLNAALPYINVAMLVYVLPTSTMCILCEEKLGDLSVEFRAALLDGIQKAGWRRQASKWVANIVCSTTGRDLTTLKSLVDDGGDIHNMHKLLYKDVTDDACRRRIFAHLKVQAEMLNSQRSQASPMPFKVLSDVDDTLISSGGHFPAGCDTRFPRRALYPGVLALFRELDLGHDRGRDFANLFITVDSPSGAPAKVPVKVTDTISDVVKLVESTIGMTPQQQQLALRNGVSLQDAYASPGDAAAANHCNLVFLSARPHAVKDFAEQPTYRLFKRLRDRGMMHTMPTLLPGRLSSGVQAVVGLLTDRALQLFPSLTIFAGNRTRHVKQLQQSLLAAVRGTRSGSTTTTPSLLSPRRSSVGTSATRQSRPRRSIPLLRSVGKSASDVKWRPLPSAAASWRPVGVAKFETFKEYATMYGEYAFVFIGDNGQGDVLASELMMADDDSNLTAAIIHTVMPVHKTLTTYTDLTLGERRDAWHSNNIFFVDSYVGAAIAVFKLGLIHAKGLHRICLRAVEDFYRVALRFPTVTESAAQYVNDLNRDIRLANEQFPEKLSPIGPVSMRLVRRQRSVAVSASSAAPPPYVAQLSSRPQLRRTDSKA